MNGPRHPRKLPSQRAAVVAAAATVVAGWLAVTAFAATRTATTVVSGTVVQVVRITVPQQVRASVCSRRTSNVADVPVTVVTNARGYTLQALRVRFTPVDDAAELMLDRPGQGLVADLPSGQWRTLGVGPVLAVGHRTTQTTISGDRWSTHLRFGTVGPRQTGALSGSVTYRVTAGGTITNKVVAVALQVNGNCGGDRGDR